MKKKPDYLVVLMIVVISGFIITNIVFANYNNSPVNQMKAGYHLSSH